jgi:CubicO group peptidase (beta-lactamase class C family)
MKRWSSSLALLLALGSACSADSGTPGASVSPFANMPGGAQNPDGSGATTPGDNAGSGTANPEGTVNAGPTNPGAETGGDGLPLGMTPGQAVDPSSVDAQPLPHSTPEAQGLSSESVLALVNALDAGVHEIHSLVLLRHGQIVAEGFWAPYSADDIQVLYSGSKSFNATAIGFLVQEGALSVDDLVLSKFPDLAPAQPDPNMAAMRIVDLLTMSTGHAADTIDRLRAAPNNEWTRAFLATAVENPPGSPFIYNSGAAYMLSAIVQRVSGMTVEEYLTPRLFVPLGIQKHLWGLSPEGVNLGDGGLAVRTEDFAKLGQLYLQNGSWNGQPVLAPEWVTAATSREVSTGNNDGNWSFGYGYQFWRSRVGYRADGSLGQYSFVLPEQDMVLAITSGTDNSSGTNNLMNIVFSTLPAVQAEALPENPGSQQALLDRLSSLSLALPTGTASSPMASQVSGDYVAAANSQGITALSFDFAAATPLVTITDADGPHVIPVGAGQWARGRTGFKKRINELFDTADQGIAAQGAWSADDTFSARLVFTETPYTAITNFKFEGNRVLLDVGYNVRWGAASEPQVSATR